MKKTFAFIVLILTILCMLCVWPFCLVRRDIEYTSGDTQAYAYTKPLFPGDTAVQYFQPQETFLKELCFVPVLGEQQSDDTTVTFRFYDSSQKMLAEKAYTMSRLQEDTFCIVPFHKWMKKDAEYCYTVSVNGTKQDGITLPYTPDETNFAPGNTRFMVNDSVIPGQNYTKYVYKEPLNYKNVICMWAFILMIGFSVIYLIRMPEKAPDTESSNR